jgi:hypothetical protein
VQLLHAKQEVCYFCTPKLGKWAKNTPKSWHAYCSYIDTEQQFFHTSFSVISGGQRRFSPPQTTLPLASAFFFPPNMVDSIPWLKHDAT